MLASSQSRNLSVPSTSGRVQHRSWGRICTGRVLATRIASTASAAAPCQSSLAAEESGPAEYAVISTPTGQQLVEEGKWFALCCQGTLQASSGDGQLRFPAVAVKRMDGEFVKGKPYLPDWVVEAQLVDEHAFELHGVGKGSGSSSLLGKVLVTKIKHTEETRQLVEEALMA